MQNQDFQRQFEDFFGENDKGPKGTQPLKADQSGSVIFQYNEEDEYFENLKLSGNFLNCANSRESKSSSNHRMYYETSLESSSIFTKSL